MHLRAGRLAAAVMAGLLLSPLPSAASAGYEPVYDGKDGATCHYFNEGIRLRWRNKGGDWIDARGRVQGDAPVGEISVADLDRPQKVQIDVTSLVRGKLKQGTRHVQLVLRAVPGEAQGSIPIASREARNTTDRPRLLVGAARGASSEVFAAADTTLDCSTVYSIGNRDTIAPGHGKVAILRFEIPESLPSDIVSVALALSTTATQYGPATLGVYQLAVPDSGFGKAELGIAARYPNDRGLEKDPAAYFTEAFESVFWRRNWSEAAGDEFETIADDIPLRFEALDGRALRVNLAKGKNLGADLRYRFAQKTGHEPDEVYFRYYLRLANDWDPSVDGGKLPGISGTYNRGGWGGRRSDGRNGWSTRGEFFKAPEKENPAHGLTAIGTYAYHADQGDHWGDAWPWTATALGVLERNRWYCIEQHVRLNTPGRHDGVFRAWVDGKLAFEQAGIRFRDIPELAIEMIWVNVYHGGQTPSPHDQHLYIDNIVIAREYIGPMGDKSSVGR